MLDYVGHGSTEELSDERVITHNDILGYKYEHLPLWITTTCDFCRFDDVQTSAGEDVLLNKKVVGLRCSRPHVFLLLILMKRLITI